MIAIAASYPTVAIASDLGIEAAREFERFLASLTARGLVEPSDHRVWEALESSGWLAAGEDPGSEALHLLDLVELAIVWGRHLIPAPFLTTLIARRHIASGALHARGGYTYALVPGPGALVPFGDFGECTFLTRLQTGEVVAGRLSSDATDTFAASLPLTTSATGSVMDSEIARETITLLAAEAIGMAEALLDRTIEYTNVRKAYGQEIAKFQAIRFRLADVHCDIEAMRGFVVAAVNDVHLAPRAAQLAVRTCRKIAETCIQTHGAIGFTWDLGLHCYLRHAMAAERLLSQYAAGSS
jgi:hypothetical protein